MADRGQISLSEALMSDKVGRNDMLERLVDEVKWYRLEKLLRGLITPGAGRPPFDPVLMFRALLLQQWYRLSDAELEEALNDRLSFRRFLGLSLEESAPDHTTLCRYRARLTESGLAEKLFAEFERQLDKRGLLLKRGTMIDASLVASPHHPPSADKPEEAVDPDAAITARKGKHGTHYGYKVHLGVDQGSRIIRKAKLTPANVNDTVPADGLVSGDETAVYADKAYSKRSRREALRKRNIKPRIMHKSWGGGPQLTAWQKRHNRLISKIRAEVEGVFATMKRWMAYDRVRYRGLARNEAHLFVLAIAYNMTRAVKLAT